MFEQMVSDVIIEEQRHSFRDAQRYGPAGDGIRQARRRPVRGFVQRVAARIPHRRPAPAYRPPVGATQTGG